MAYFPNSQKKHLHVLLFMKSNFDVHTNVYRGKIACYQNKLVNQSVRKKIFAQCLEQSRQIPHIFHFRGTLVLSICPLIFSSIHF